MKRETTSESPRTETTDAEVEAVLVAGFLSREPSAELLFLAEMRRLFQFELKINWRRLWRDGNDLEQGALLKLYELRETAEGRETIRPPLPALAKTLFAAPAKRLTRAPKMLPLGDWDAPTEPEQEELARLKWLLGLASQLPLSLRTALRAHVAYVTGEGPPPHIVLGVRENAARMQVTRAQDAVYRIAAEAEEKEAEENDD